MTTSSPKGLETGGPQSARDHDAAAAGLAVDEDGPVARQLVQVPHYAPSVQLDGPGDVPRLVFALSPYVQDEGTPELLEIFRCHGGYALLSQAPEAGNVDDVVVYAYARELVAQVARLGLVPRY